MLRDKIVYDTSKLIIKKKILLIYYQDSYNKLILSFLERNGFEVDIVQSPSIEIFKNKEYNLIITNLKPIPLKELDFIVEIRDNLNIKSPIIVLSSFGPEKIIIDAFKLGINDFIKTPFILNVLLVKIFKFIN